MNVPQVSGFNLESRAVARDGRPRPAPESPVGDTGQAERAASAQEHAAAREAQANATAEQLREAVAEMNRAMRLSNRALEFSIDQETDRLVVRLTDGETGELIRQFPSDETLAISRYIAEVQNGLLLSQKA